MPKRIGFYCELPKATIKDIKVRAKTEDKCQWEIITDSVDIATAVRKQVAKAK